MKSKLKGSVQLIHIDISIAYNYRLAKGMNEILLTEFEDYSE